MSKSSAAYDTYDYPSYWKSRNYEHESEVFALKSLLSSIGELGELADVGAGFGRLLPYYKKRSKRIVLADPSTTLLTLAKDKYKKARNKLTFVHSTVEDLTNRVTSESLDTVVFIRVMHHLDNPQKAIKSISKILKNNGFVVLEFANKIHVKASLKRICQGDIWFRDDKTPTDRRCAKNQNLETICFYNYHPDTIFRALSKNHFKVREVRSVSNIRSELLKKILPLKLLIAAEKLLQRPLSRVYFGPSIFILAQKQSP